MPKFSVVFQEILEHTVSSSTSKKEQTVSGAQLNQSGKQVAQTVQMKMHSNTSTENHDLSALESVAATLQMGLSQSLQGMNISIGMIGPSFALNKVAHIKW